MWDRSGGVGSAVVVASLALALSAEAVHGQVGLALGTAAAVEARVWLDRGDEPLLRQGDQVRVYYRASQDAYVAIFHIDTDGTSSLVLPHSPDEDHYVRGGRDYRLLFPRSPYWYVEDRPGIGYYFIVASAEQFDFSSFRFSHYDRGWDLSLVGRQVYRDPYMAMDDYVAALLPGRQDRPYALDFTSYHVGERQDFPRFLCYNCHPFRSYTAWNPYYTVCTGFRVVIYDDPYFYPARRYRGKRVVWARPPTANRARFAFKERLSGEPAGVVVLPRAISDGSSPFRTSVQRRSPGDGAGARRGGEAQPSNEPVNLGIIRGRATAPAATPIPPVPWDGGSGQPAPLRPSERGRGGVAVSGAGSPAPATQVRDRPEGTPGTIADPRVRPVLRKRPSEGAGETAPSGGRAGRTRSAPPERASQPSTSGAGGRVVRPTPPPAPRPSTGDRGKAVPRPPAGRASPPPERSGGARERPVVRTNPSGRPVIR